MRAVNLLPKDANQRGKSLRSEDPAVVVGSALGVIVLIALVAGFMNVHSKVNAEQQKLTAARIELARLAQQKRAAPTPYKPVKQKPIVPVPAVASEEQPRLTALSTALATRIAWDRILREFSLVLPSDVSLSTLALMTPSPASAGATTGAPTTAGGQNLTIDGTTYSHDAVARLLSRLMLIPDLTNVTLASSTASADSGLVQFNITAGVKGAPAPPAPAPAPVVPAATTTTGGTS
jgi:Tfp pilus assembly protein PilN